MRRGWKIVSWIIGVCLALIVVLLIVIATFDWNRLKPTINARASETLGRPFAINGDLSVRWRREERASGIEGWVPVSLSPWQAAQAGICLAGSPCVISRRARSSSDGETPGACGAG